MANSLAGVNLSRIAQLSLDALVTEGIPLSAFVTDFSGEVKSSGDVITTRFPTVTGTVDFSSTKAAGDATLTSRPVTLNQYRGVKKQFSDLEMSFSDVELSELFVVPAISALVDFAINYLLSQATVANGFTAYVEKTAAQLDADAVADLAQAMTTAKIPKAGRSLILKPTYHATLAKDAKLGNVSAVGVGGVTTENVLPRIHGLTTHEYNGTIPSNSEFFEGIALNKSALLMAARAVAIPDSDMWYGKKINIVEPRTKLPIQVSAHYDGVKYNYEWSLLFGGAVGLAANAVRIVSDVA